MLALVNAANDILRAQAQHQAIVQIEYLSKELLVVSNAEHRQVLTTLLLGQEQSLMLSRSNLPYAAQVLSPPTTHFSQAKPSIALTLAIGVFVGLFLGIFVAFFREASARSRQRLPRDSLEVLREWRNWRPNRFS
jgi:LPS O-antigen subunit length determinant protein (WzzB/FepE family)